MVYQAPFPQTLHHMPRKHLDVLEIDTSHGRKTAAPHPVYTDQWLISNPDFLDQMARVVEGQIEEAETLAVSSLVRTQHLQVRKWPAAADAA
jgi:hypothetical protein